MRRYRYNYQTIIRFSIPVRRHFFLLRCMPCVNAFQQISRRDLFLAPKESVIYGADSWRNPIQYGSVLEPHDSFMFVSSGEARMEPYGMPLERDFYKDLFVVQTPNTAVTDDMKQFLEEKRGGMSGLQLAQTLAEELYNYMQYTPGSTSVTTTAAEAFGQRAGVCQDYAQILIALCREAGIPARYANGFITGLGTTHAWVEVCDGGRWFGIDPTNNVTEMDFGYIKITHGRDVSDCIVCKYRYDGLGAAEQLEVRIIVEEI